MNTKTSSESDGVTDKLNTLLEPFPTLASAFTLLIVPVTPVDLACTYAESINAITAAESVPPPLVNVPVGNLAESIVPDDIAEDIRRKLDEKEGKTNGKTDPSKIPSFEDVMGMNIKDYLGEVAKIGEEAKNKDMLRSGISSLAYSPLIGSQAAMESAANISKLTGVNMAAIANQGDVMAQNPTKQRYAGKYFR